jgi:hypothetical protein
MEVFCQIYTAHIASKLHHLTVNNMKIKIALILLTTFPIALNAQTWSGTTPGNIYYNSGNVGIGTSTPNAKLHIPDGAAIIGGNTTVNPTHLNSSLVVISKDNNNTTYPLYVGQPTGSDIFWLKGNGNGFFLGNVGLGTATPNAKLHIPNGTAIVGGDASFNPAGLNYSVAIQSKDNQDTTYPFYVGQPSGADIFWLKGNGNGYFLGQVGIGTTNPDAKLTVAGDIHSREVKVTVNAGADFVFNDNYALRPLNEIEKFVKENKHLPDIEPAKTMEENGIELGKMDIKLLQKIEELTLYMIDFKKEMESLKEENQKLKQEIKELKEN